MRNSMKSKPKPKTGDTDHRHAQINGNLDYNYYFKVPIVPAFSQDFSSGSAATSINNVINEFGTLDSKLPGLIDNASLF